MTSSDGGPGSWTEASVRVPNGWHELVAETLGRPPGNGAVVGATDDPRATIEGETVPIRTYLAPGEDGPSARATLERRLSALAERAEVPELAGLRIAFRTLAPEEWVDSWKRHWKPFRVGPFSIVTPDRTGVPRKEGDLPIVLEPGRAFGTGRHATTRTCLLELARRLRPGDRVLDAGTGSGILCVAAAKLGAAACLGFDLHPSAGSVFDRLVDDNGVREACTFRPGGFDAVRDAGRFDVVLANLFSDVLQAHAHDLARHLAPGGWLAASGCPVAHREATARSIEAAGLAIEKAIVRGRWCTFLASLTA